MKLKIRSLILASLAPASQFWISLISHRDHVFGICMWRTVVVHHSSMTGVLLLGMNWILEFNCRARDEFIYILVLNALAYRQQTVVPFGGDQRFSARGDRMWRR